MKKLCFALYALMLLMTSGCTVKYTLSGASIPPDAKTFSVAYFPNNAPMVAPILSATLTDELTQRFATRTRLVQVPEGGDFAFDGEIIGYTSTTSSVSSGDYALQNRLTITVKVNFTNVINPDDSFNQTFKAYTDYDSTTLLTDIQSELDAEIVEQLVHDIFQAAASNW
jgi:hypothetical protein